MAEVTPPSPEQLQRELDQLRAAQPPPAAQPGVGKLLAKRAVRVLLIWFLLICAFLAIWQFLVPVEPPR